MLVDTQHHPLIYAFLVTVIVIYFALQIVIVRQGLQVFIYQIKLKPQVKYDVGADEQYDDVAVREAQEAEIVDAAGEVGPVAKIFPGEHHHVDYVSLVAYQGQERGVYQEVCYEDHEAKLLDARAVSLDPFLDVGACGVYRPAVLEDHFAESEEFVYANDAQRESHGSLKIAKFEK